MGKNVIDQKCIRVSFIFPLIIDHGNPCTGSEANFCMNGGTCFKIPSVSTPTCV